MALSVPIMFYSEPALRQVSGATQPTPSIVQPDLGLIIDGETNDNSKVTQSVVGSSLRIATGRTTVEASSILDISTNEDSQQDIIGAAKLATVAIPYGGGLVLSLLFTPRGRPNSRIYGCQRRLS